MFFLPLIGLNQIANLFLMKLYCPSVVCVCMYDINLFTFQQYLFIYFIIHIISSQPREHSLLLIRFLFVMFYLFVISKIIHIPYNN